MDKSLCAHSNSQTLTAPLHISALSQQPQLPPCPTPATLSDQDDLQDAYNADIFAFLDVTQGLAENLGTHLGSHEAMGSGMWSWMDDNVTGHTDTFTSDYCLQ
jgi:hypothetical protein